MLDTAAIITHILLTEIKGTIKAQAGFQAPSGSAETSTFVPDKPTIFGRQYTSSRKNE